MSRIIDLQRPEQEALRAKARNARVAGRDDAERYPAIAPDVSRSDFEHCCIGLGRKRIVDRFVDSARKEPVRGRVHKTPEVYGTRLALAIKTCLA